MDGKFEIEALSDCINEYIDKLRASRDELEVTKGKLKTAENTIILLKRQLQRLSDKQLGSSKV